MEQHSGLPLSSGSNQSIAAGAREAATGRSWLQAPIHSQPQAPCYTLALSVTDHQLLAF